MHQYQGFIYCEKSVLVSNLLKTGNQIQIEKKKNNPKKKSLKTPRKPLKRPSDETFKEIRVTKVV